MANMLAEGTAWLTKQLMANASNPITYSRDAISHPLDATIGTTPFESMQHDGSVLRFDSKDFLIAADVFTKLFNKPQDGDRIFDGVGTYEVLSPSGEQPYRYCDAARTLLRIHTKQVS